MPALTAQLGPGSSIKDLLDQTMAQVRKEPAAVKHRISLFQLLSINGMWEKALTQLGVLSDLDKESESMVGAYREVLKCEMLRVEVFAGKRTPLFIGEPEDWSARLMEALRAGAGGKHVEAAELRAAAFEAAPARSGSINGEAFEWIADADVRLGPVVEAVVSGKYYWIPFHRISGIEIEAPSDLRDMVWCPAVFTFVGGGEQVGFIPTRYPDSEKSADEAIRLARKTEWTDLGSENYTGLGQRMLATDGGDFALLDVRSIKFDAEAD